MRSSPVLGAENAGSFRNYSPRQRRAAAQCLPTVSPIKDSAGHVVGASKVARDITERKKAEAALKKAARTLRLPVSSECNSKASGRRARRPSERVA